VPVVSPVLILTKIHKAGIAVQLEIWKILKKREVAWSLVGKSLSTEGRRAGASFSTAPENLQMEKDAAHPLAPEESTSALGVADICQLVSFLFGLGSAWTKRNTCLHA
jgi:hypothetical protein